MMTLRLASIALLLTLLLPTATPARADVSAPLVVASVEPLAMVLRELYGERVQVATLLTPNQNPHHPMLSPRQVLALRQANLLVWLGPQADPAVAELVKAREGPSLALTAVPGVVVRGAEVDEHGRTAPGSIDPHLWLDPDNMAALARALAERTDLPLAAGEPQGFLQRLRDTDRTLQQRLAAVADRPWLTYHQPWAYFQAHYGLADPVVVSRQLDVGTSSSHFVEMAGEIERRNVRCAIIEPEAQAGIMKRLCPDCRRQPLDPLGRDHAGERYTPWLVSVAAAFRHCLAGH